jgi:hypothetical protein
MALRLTLLLLGLGAAFCVSAQAISTDTKDYQTARKRLYLGTDTAAYFTAIRQAISVASAHKHLPTAKAVYDFLQTFAVIAQPGSGADAAKIKFNNDISNAVNLRGTDGVYADVVTSAEIEIGLRDASVPVGKMAQSGAATGNVLTWSGTAWMPSPGSGGYTYVVASSTIATTNNKVLIGTLAGNITLGLPNCDAANDGKSFHFQRTGQDTQPYAFTIDPSGSQTFHDLRLSQTVYGSGVQFHCTCRFASSTGTWFFNF